MNNKTIGLMLIASGVTIAGTTLAAVVQTNRLYKAKNELENTEIKLTVANRWLNSALKVLPVDRFPALMEDALESAEFEFITKDF